MTCHWLRGSAATCRRSPRRFTRIRATRRCGRGSVACPASALSQKFHPILWTQGIALEGPTEWVGDSVPMMNEPSDSSGAFSVRRVAGPCQDLAFQDAEPDFDLVQPRRMQRQELEAHSTGLGRDPGADGGCRVCRQVVGHDHQTSSRPATPDRLQQFEELASTASTPYLDHDLTPADVPAPQNRQDPMPSIVVLDALRPTTAHRTARVHSFEDLALRLLVHADHSGPTRGMQVKTHHTADLETKVWVGAVQPAPNAMRFERSLLEPSSYRALADGLTNESPPTGGLRQGAQRPVTSSRRQLRGRVTRQAEDFMPLFGGKTSAAVPNAHDPAVLATATSESGAANAEPISDRAPAFGRLPRRSDRSRPGAQPGRGWRSRYRCGPAGGDGEGPSAPGRSIVTMLTATRTFSWPRGYLMSSFPWGGTF